MALIKCPECGRDGVSNSATMCPGCGYNLKDHFEQLRKREQTERAEKERVQRIRNAIQKDSQPVSDEERKKRGLKKLDEQRREKKNELNAFIGGISLFVVFLFIMLCIEQWGAVLILVVLIAFFGALAYGTYGEYQQILADIETASKDFDEYTKSLVSRLKKNISEINEDFQVKHPVCPNCGGRDTQRISTANRATSIAMVGLASSKIGKQYECKKCKHKW